jgi:glycosyltransferase involved in cell wall biosynthesis
VIHHQLAGVAKFGRKRLFGIGARVKTIMSPRIDVCIPVYNGALYIGHAVESVLAQTFPDYRLTVVDNCSTDNTVSIVARYHDPRLRFVRNSQNLGMVRNWNRCIELTDSELLLILHHDDFLSPSFLADVIHFFDTHPTVGLVSSGARPINMNGNINWWAWVLSKRYRGHGNNRVLASGAESVLYLMRYGVSISGIVVPRTVYENLGKFDSCMQYSADEEMWVRIGAHYPIGLMTKTIVYQRIHPAQFRNETWKQPDFFDQYLAIQKLRFSFLSKDEQQACGGDDFVQHLVTKAAQVIALRCLAAGELYLAKYYLDMSKKISPRSVKKAQYKIIQLLCHMPKLCRLVCRVILSV